MTNRFHLPVVVTTSDDLRRDDVVDFVERVLANLEETDDIYRTYVEDSGIEEAEAERMLEMLGRIDDDNLGSAIDALEEITEGEE